MIDYGDTVFAAQRLRMKKAGISLSPSTSRKQLILIIDDSPEIVEALNVAFAPRYRVIGAQNGQQGLARFKQHQHDVSLVILDMNMPVMNGEAALDALRALDPDVKVIISSGMDEAETKERCAAHDGLHFLPKPYDLDTARKCVQAALGNGSSAP